MTTPSPVSVHNARAYALAYAKRGWPVFPLHEALGDGQCSCGKQCGNPGKHPRTRNGLKSATTDAAQIHKWWTDTPNAPIGIVCGDQHGLLVIDIDPRNGGQETWNRIASEHDPIVTAHVRTGGGGSHIYLAAPPIPIKSRGNALGPGVDIASNGHYVVAPPSLHASGARYEFAQGAGPGEFQDLAECPQWIVDLANAAKPRKSNGQTAPADTRGWIAVAFDAAGKLGEWQASGGFWFASCPWLHEHSDGRGDGKDSSCIVYPPSAGKTLGWWRCEHAHCSTRTLDDVKRVLPDAAKDVAWKVYPKPAKAKPAPTPKADPPHDPQTGEVTAPDVDWQADIMRNAEGIIQPCLLNAHTILCHDPQWAGVLIYDEFAERITFAKPAPWPDSKIGDALSDEDATRLSLWLHRTWSMKIAPEPCWKILQVVGRRQTIHPVRAYLASLAWDGRQRLPTMARDYFGASDTPYHCAVMLRWMISGVARIMSPGCRADCVLILEGPQGKKKSSALAALAGDSWFCDDIGDIRDKDSADALRGKWISELSELASVRRSELEPVKAFLSRRVDHFRPAYARVTIDRPRQTIFAGTTNASEYQTDPTGLRRFWAVACAGTIDLDALRRDRDCLWAESVARYSSGEQWWLTETEDPLQVDEQNARRETDPWTEQVVDWCNETLLPITVAAILDDCLKIEPGRRTMVDARRVGAILRLAGYVVTGLTGPSGARAKRWGRSQ